MGTKITIPSPQHKYLEPYKSRVFQYDTKHSNLFLSHYVNQILNAVGDDSIIRGFEVTPTINSTGTGIDFHISAGALVQDLTYFEVPNDTVIPMDDLIELTEFYIIVYTNYRYIETVYENPLKIEATLYNPRTRKTLSPWNPKSNRIILGIYSFDVKNEEVVDVTKEDRTTIFFDELNTVKNGTFDAKNTNSWIPINSVISVTETGGALDTPYITVKPSTTGSEAQGVAQVMQTKPNTTYDVSFYVKSDESEPFEVLILDKSSPYDLNNATVLPGGTTGSSGSSSGSGSGSGTGSSGSSSGGSSSSGTGSSSGGVILDKNALDDIADAEIKTYESTSTKKWNLHTFRFTAFSTQTTIYFLKKSDNIENTISFDHISSSEYTPVRKETDLNHISLIDGGRIPSTDNVITDEQRESYVYEWHFTSKENQFCYELDSTVPSFRPVKSGFYLVFFGGSKLYEKDYYIDADQNKIYFNQIINKANEEIAIYFIKRDPTCLYKWELEPSDKREVYAPTVYEENFQCPNTGQYLVFYNSTKLHEQDYTLNVCNNTIQLSKDVVNIPSYSDVLTVYYFTDPIVYQTWTINTVPGVTSYYLSGNEKFPSTTKGKYLVFLDGVKVSEDDYLIKTSNGSITLDVPVELSMPLMIHYFGNPKDPIETPIDYDYDIYHWKFNLKTGQNTYIVDKSQDAFKSVNYGYYLIFKDGKKVKSNDYSINSAAGSISLPSNMAVNDSVLDVYFIKKPANKTYNWSITTQANVKTYTQNDKDPAFPSPENGVYMVFLDDKKLNKDQYNVLITSSTIRLSNTLTVNKNQNLHIYYFMNPPITCKFWSFNSVKGLASYTPNSSQLEFTNLSEGEYLLFKNNIKLPEDEFKIDKYKNSLILSTPPQENGATFELYFLGKE